MPKKIVILYSGGLDSFLMREYAKKYYNEDEIILLYYKHGAPSEEEEISLLPKNVIIKEIDWLNDDIKPVAKKSDPFAGDIYIPGRNLVFAVLAASQYLPDQIWIGALYDECNEQATDKNDIFLEGVNAVIKYVLSPFKTFVEPPVRFPFVEEKWSKLNVLEWYKKQSNYNEDELLKTVSCWNYNNKFCNECKQCFKRYLIMSLIGINEGYVYNDFFRNMEAEYLNAKDRNLDEENVVSMINELERIK